jgi:hypothetical protein
MTRFRVLLLSFAIALAAAATLPAQATDPREQSYQFFVDGVQTVGIIGYQLNFNHSTVSRTDSRQLDTAFSADQRLITLSVTQKGLNRLQDIINSATSTGTPAGHALGLVVRKADQTVLVRWDFANAFPTTVLSSAQGSISEADATVSFLFDTMTQSQANPN